jgi:hypothetical protein
MPQPSVSATSRTSILPSVLRRTVKGNSAVIVIGVDRRSVGCDDGASEDPNAAESRKSSRGD